MLDKTELERRVSAMAQSAFGQGIIREVHCTRDVDHEGDPVVWVQFVVRDGAMPFDTRISLPFGPKLRLAFDDWGETAYPVTFFYPEREYRTVRPAVA